MQLVSNSSGITELGLVAVSTGAPPPASSSFPEKATLMNLKETKSPIWII